MPFYCCMMPLSPLLLELLVTGVDLPQLGRPTIPQLAFYKSVNSAMKTSPGLQISESESD